MIAGIIQARMSSSRLPGKVLRPIAGRPMLSWLVERARACRSLDALAVATSTHPSDDPIFNWCRATGLTCVRGPLDDVLARYQLAATRLDATTIVRLTGDNPLIDPAVVDRVVALRDAGDYDYASNTAPPPGTFPQGFDLEVFTRYALEYAAAEAEKPSDREHVTFYLWKNPDLFRIARLNHEPDLSHLRLTVDNPEDFEVVRTVIESLGIRGGSPAMAEIVAFLQQYPDIAAKNAHIPAHAGWTAALAADEAAGFARQ